MARFMNVTQTLTLNFKQLSKTTQLILLQLLDAEMKQEKHKMHV